MIEDLERRVSLETVDPEIVDLVELEAVDDLLTMDLLMEMVEATMNHHHLMEKSIVLYHISSRSR